MTIHNDTIRIKNHEDHSYSRNYPTYSLRVNKKPAGAVKKQHRSVSYSVYRMQFLQREFLKIPEGQINMYILLDIFKGNFLIYLIFRLYARNYGRLFIFKCLIICVLNMLTIYE